MGNAISNIVWMSLGRNDDEAEEALFELNPELNGAVCRYKKWQAYNI
ncbi:hypothetical protein THO17_06720 [Marinomonas sp. THO17]